MNLAHRKGPASFSFFPSFFFFFSFSWEGVSGLYTHTIKVLDAQLCSSPDLLVPAFDHDRMCDAVSDEQHAVKFIPKQSEDAEDAQPIYYCHAYCKRHRLS